jgi:hypothetical protein
MVQTIFKVLNGYPDSPCRQRKTRGVVASRSDILMVMTAGLRSSTGEGKGSTFGRRARRSGVLLEQTRVSEYEKKIVGNRTSMEIDQEKGEPKTVNRYPDRDYPSSEGGLEYA